MKAALRHSTYDRQYRTGKLFFTKNESTNALTNITKS